MHINKGCRRNSALPSIPTSKDRSNKMKEFLFSNEKDIVLHYLISSQFSRFFNTYAQAFNKMYSRYGNLFQRPFKRSKFDESIRFGYLLYYIHHNSRKHGIVKDFKEDEWHSYQRLVDERDGFLDHQFVFDWFGGKAEFIRFHNETHSIENFRNVWIER